MAKLIVVSRGSIGFVAHKIDGIGLPKVVRAERVDLATKSWGRLVYDLDFSRYPSSWRSGLVSILLVEIGDDNRALPILECSGAAWVYSLEASLLLTKCVFEAHDNNDEEELTHLLTSSSQVISAPRRKGIGGVAL